MNDVSIKGWDRLGIPTDIMHMCTGVKYDVDMSRRTKEDGRGAQQHQQLPARHVQHPVCLCMCCLGGKPVAWVREGAGREAFADRRQAGIAHRLLPYAIVRRVADGGACVSFLLSRSLSWCANRIESNRIESTRDPFEGPGCPVKHLGWLKRLDSIQSIPSNQNPKTPHPTNINKGHGPLHH